ncbi:MAG: hypothetical protein ABWJ42_06085 [Sulfolobales archaeon]
MSLLTQKFFNDLKRIYLTIKPTAEPESLKKQIYLMISFGVATLAVFILISLKIYFSIYVALLVEVLLLLFIMLVVRIIIAPLVRYIEYKKDLDEETPYLVLLAASSPVSGNELGHLLDRVSSHSEEYRIFSISRRIAVKIRNLARFTGSVESLRIVSEFIPSSRFRKIIKNYLINRSLGTQRVYLEILLEDLMRDLSNIYKRVISVRVNILTLSLVVFTIVAIIVSTLSVIYGASIIAYAELFVFLASLLITFSTPRHPLPLRVVRRDVISYIANTLSLLLLSILSLTILASSLYSNTLLYQLKKYILYNLYNLSIYSLSTLLISLVSLYNFLASLRELQVDREILINSQSHVRVYKELSSFREDSLIKNGYKLWITGYILFTIGYMREIGEIIGDLYDKFCEKMLELFSAYKNYIISSIMSFFIIFIQPILFYQIEYIAVSKESIFELSILTIVSTSLIASKILFDEQINGFIGSLQILFYIYLTRGVSI